MTDGLRIAHPQDCPLEGNPEVGNPEGNRRVLHPVGSFTLSEQFYTQYVVLHSVSSFTFFS